MDFLKPITLTGQHVKLIPLTLSHHDNLIEAVKDGNLWELWYTPIPSPEQMQTEIQRRLNLYQQRSMLPFSVFDLEQNKIVGMTTFMNIDEINRRVEIGSTWYAKSVQRTKLNTECKLLLLSYAFEQLNCIAVEFRTSFMNQQSRKAIERLGAKLDGILRNHRIIEDDIIRDTCVYSIIAHEWPSIKAHLKFKLK